MTSNVMDVDDSYDEEGTLEQMVVPWYNAEEFLKVRECLYSNKVTEKRWAVDQMTVWDTRCHPSLPTAIEASLALARAIIQDTLFANEATLCQEKEIQMLYSMALVRFVNLSIELHQGSQKQNSAHIARGLGIPSWVVDLRNEATHSMTPSLPMLRLGAEAAMKYLNESFWSVESERVRNVVKEPVDIQSFRELLFSFQVEQFHLFRHKNVDSEKYKSQKGEISRTLRKIVRYLNQNREKFLEILVMDGHFVTEKVDLKIMLTDKELSDFYGRNPNEESDSEGEEDNFVHPPKLPSTLEKYWQPLLYKLNIIGAIPEFVETLLNTRLQRSQTGQRLIASWVLKILKASMQSDCKKISMTRLFFKEGPLFNWDRLLYATVSYPCKFTPFIFPLIASHMELTEEYLRSLMNLVAIALGQGVTRGRKFSKDHSAFTLDTLKKDIKLQDAKLKQKKGGRNLWSVAPDSIDFKNIPMGEVFKSSEEEEGPMTERVYQMFYTDEIKYTWTLGLNKNDTDDMEESDTVEKDIVEETDEEILNRTEDYLYRKLRS